MVIDSHRRYRGKVEGNRS